METKEKLIIFDIDGCMANSDEFILTKKEAYDKEIKNCKSIEEAKKFIKPKKSEENEFDLDYFKRHHSEIEPHYGVFDLFVKLSQTSKVAIITARYEILKQVTYDWLISNTIKLYGDGVWRQMSYFAYFNENFESSLQFKKGVIESIMKTYDILLLIEDHPKVVEWAKSKNIETLVPATGYKDLSK